MICLRLELYSRVCPLFCTTFQLLSQFVKSYRLSLTDKIIQERIIQYALMYILDVHMYSSALLLFLFLVFGFVSDYCQGKSEIPAS